MIVVLATEAGWQERCLELAKARAEFTIQGICFEDRIFIQNLCLACEYNSMKFAANAFLAPLFKK